MAQQPILSEILRDMRLLVADDEFSNVDVLLNILDNVTDHIFYAPNGKVACELAIKHQPDLIILDWQMPELDGISTIHALKSHNSTQAIPIIIATGIMTNEENLSQALEAGAVDFLKKPFSRVEFLARVGAALRIKKQHDTITEMLSKETEYMKELLDAKSRELTSMAVLDFQKNSLLQQLLDQVGRLDRITNHVYATDIHAIEKELKAQLNLDKSWENFKLHFDRIHSGFFEKLDSTYRSLTLNERKLSAYIKMGMGNYEISEMTGSSDAALRKAINRMKKKLNLGPADDVRKFFFEF